MLNKLIPFLVIVIIILHGFILTKLIYFPYPEIFIYPYLTNNGLKPYQQILDQHFPGLFFLPINFDNLGLSNEIIARYWSIGIVVLTHILIFFIMSKILKSKPKAILANLLYLIWQPFFEGWILWIDSFLPLILLPSFYAYYNKKLVISGLLLGIGIIFKQTLLPLTFLLILYTLWDSKSVKKTSLFLISILIPVALMLLYFINLGILRDFWYWTIVFNLTIYASLGTKSYVSLGFVTRLVFVYITSVFAWFNKDRRLVYLLFIFLAGSLAGIFDRAGFIHFQPSLPFVILATTIGTYRFNKTKFFVLVIFVYLLISGWWLHIFYSGHISNKVFFFDEQTKLTALKIKQYTKADDKIFVFGAPAHLYQMAERLPAGSLFVFQFPWFLKVAEDRILEGLVKDPPKIIVYDTGYEVEGVFLKDFSPKINKYVETHYKKVDNVNTNEILQRKD